MIGVCVLLTFLNKTFSYIREVTYVFASSYLWLGLADKALGVIMVDGVVLSLVTMLLAFMLFGIYQSPYPQRRVYLISTLLSACCMFNYTYIYLIPVFFFGFMQMRAMNLRSALAMIFGLASPFWIALGMGLMTFSDIQFPQPEGLWNNMGVEQSGLLIGVLAFTGLFTLVLLGINVLRIINYKMQVRAYNGFFLVLTLCTIIVMAVDYNNVLVYLPVLNICLAVQSAHTFTIKKHLRRYIWYLLFVVLCTGLFVWKVLC